MEAETAHGQTDCLATFISEEVHHLLLVASASGCSGAAHDITTEGAVLHSETGGSKCAEFLHSHEEKPAPATVALKQRPEDTLNSR